MSAMASLAFVLLLLCDVHLLAGSRLRALIRTVAYQGVLLACLPLLLPQEVISATHLWLLAIGVGLIKGVIVPRLLVDALRSTDTDREVQPLVGYNISLLLGVGMLVLSVWVGGLPALAPVTRWPLMAPVAVFTLLAGLFLVVSRRQALTQGLGYLVFENGIYAFGMSALPEQHLLVEMGVLFDLVVGVLVMSLMVSQLNRDLGHSDVSRLHELQG